MINDRLAESAIIRTSEVKVRDHIASSGEGVLKTSQRDVILESFVHQPLLRGEADGDAGCPATVSANPSLREHEACSLSVDAILRGHRRAIPRSRAFAAT